MQKLNDAPAASRYAELASQYSISSQLSAFKRTIHAAKPGVYLGKIYMAELQRTSSNGENGLKSRLVSIRVERRCIAVAVFRSFHLDYGQARQLSSDPMKARNSAVSFVSRLLDQFPAETGALEIIPNGHEVLRRSITEDITDLLRQRSLSLWQVSKRDVFVAWGHPRPRSRKEVREIVETVCPAIDPSKVSCFIKDAAALGLYVQTERLFLN